MLLADALPLIVVAVLALPAAAFLGLGSAMLLYRAPSERFIARLTGSALGLALAGAVLTLASLLLGPRQALTVHLGRWFEVPGYAFELTLLADPLSATFMVLTTAIVGLIGRFSVTYMHREPGYARFFLLTHLFATGMLLLVMAGSMDLMFAGWELVGLSSVLLIGFFQERAAPARHGLRAFVIYRVCDVGLLMAAVLVHHFAHSARIDVVLGAGQWPLGAAHLGPAAATLVAVLLVVGAIGKSAQLPVCGWLPRAMEGPTPSSALFYGALSVHAGVYLLLRTAPVLDAAPLARGLLVAVGALSAVHATLVGRTMADAKSALAYATITQVGLLLVEIGLGLHTLALVHMIGHICVRAFQLLKAPSMLHEAHVLHAAAGGARLHTGAHVESVLPRRAQRWLYGRALARFHLDELLDGVAHAVHALARGLDRMDRRWTSLQRGASSRPEPVVHVSADTEVPRSTRP